MQKNIKTILISLVVLTSHICFADYSNGDQVGRRHDDNKSQAGQYFSEANRPAAESANDILMLYVGGYLNSTAYSWGNSGSITSPAKTNYGLTYLMDNWGHMDVNLRAEFSEYKLNDGYASQLAVMPLVTFPMVRTGFPLYFGFGAGPGVFFNQLSGSSSVGLNYQLVAGARFMNLIKNTGFFAEFGLKNLLLVGSPGQLNGTALDVGAIFAF